MTFEEFFKKKRIDLAALEQGEGSLFSEFKTNYEQVGEKSFDHTKKYWFNKLRRQFPLALEVKTEKAHISNPLAEQTITESLSETTTETPLPKLGFVPKFKAGNMPKPAVKADERTEEALNPPIIENTTPPKLGFVPKFKAGNMPKPAVKADEKTEEVTSPPVPQPAPTEKPAESAEAKPAYKPRFNMKSIPPKPTEEK